MEWFRFYHNALNNPVLMEKLSGDDFRNYLKLQSVASQQTPRGSLPPDMADLAFLLRCPEADLYRILGELMRWELVVVESDGLLWIANWREMQFESDSSAQRTKRYRERKRETAGPGADGICDAACDVTPNVTGDAPRTETDTEQKQKQTRRSRRRAPAKERPKDPLFEAIVGICYGIEIEKLTATERGRANKAAGELRKLDPPVTPQQIYQRGAEWKSRGYPNGPTPQGITGNWNDLGIKRGPADRKNHPANSGFAVGEAKHVDLAPWDALDEDERAAFRNTPAIYHRYVELVQEKASRGMTGWVVERACERQVLEEFADGDTDRDGGGDDDHGDGGGRPADRSGAPLSGDRGGHADPGDGAARSQQARDSDGAAAAPRELVGGSGAPEHGIGEELEWTA